jgi:hypothetical protein
MLERLTSSHEQYIQLVRSAPDARLLPENPSRMTFRGRYRHVDRVLQDCLFSHIPQGTQIRVLDFGAGVLETGSPTDHDTHDMLTSCGLTPHIIAVDPYMPESLHPLYLDILYTKSLPEDDAPVHIVKLLHVREHMRNTSGGAEQYNQVRADLLRRLADGGVCISTQDFYRVRWGMQGEDYIQLPTLLKVVQKRGDTFVTLALLPDCIIPYSFCSWGLPLDPQENRKHRERYLEGYQEYRQAVQNGERTLPIILNIDGYNDIVQGTEHCYGEGFLAQEEETLAPISRDIERILEESRRHAAEFFTP